jgi:predicted ATPase
LSDLNLSNVAHIQHFCGLGLLRTWDGVRGEGAARELLVPVYGWFTEGFDTLDLKEAKALLEELAA